MVMNHLPNGTIAVGAPGSKAREAAELEDLLRGIVNAVNEVVKEHPEFGWVRKEAKP
jgi:hypothetical protein